MKKLLSIFLTLCIMLSLFVPTSVMAAESSGNYDANDVAIINAMITNNDFGFYKVNDPDNWGFIQWTESTPKKVDTIWAGYLDLRGDLDLRGLTALKEVGVESNYLTSLNVSGCTNLKKIDCSGNKIDAVDISGCTALTELNVSNNYLESLDIRQCNALTELGCAYNYMTTKYKILGLVDSSHYIHYSFLPQLVAIEPTVLPVSTGTKLSIYGQNESTTFGNAALIQADGTVWAWGFPLYANKSGFSRDDNPMSILINSTDPSAPSKILDGVVAVSSGIDRVNAIKSDGSLWAWGNGTLLGDQYGDPSDKPYKVLDNVASVSAGFGYSMAVKKDGTLWGWGTDIRGGLNGTFFTEYPKPIKIMNDVVSVSASISNNEQHTMFIKKDGSLWGYGSHDYVGIDDGGIDDFLKPVKVMDNVASVCVGTDCTFAIKKDGSLWAWGLNNDGQLGVKTTITEENWFEDDIRIKPFKVMNDVVFVDSSGSSTIAIKSDGSLWGWGDNGNGQLGDNIDLGPGILPTKIMNDVTAAAVCGRWDIFTLVLKSDGVLWGLGTDEGHGLVKMADNMMMPSMSKFTPTAPTPTESALTATPTASKVLVNGTNINFDAYNISGNNYFKLRDLAKVISGTVKQFEVSWDGSKNAINLVSNKSYTSVGGELATGDGKVKTPTLSTAKIYIDGVLVQLTAYTINGNNYFKLRDVMQKFNVGVGWDGPTSTITIDTSKGYTQ